MRRLAAGVVGACVFFGIAVITHAGTVTLEGTIRDFKGSFTSTPPFTPVQGGHPQFEIFSFVPPFTLRQPTGFNALPAGQTDAAEPGIVSNSLGADMKPVWVGGSNSALFPTTKTKVNAAGDNLDIQPDDNINRANFNQWYNDASGVNQSHAISMTLDDPQDTGVFTFTNNSFFPLDGTATTGVDVDGFTGFGNESRPHNFHMTMELHTTFTYQTGQQFTFTGDDDVWVFIDQKLAVDLGGVHSSLSKTANLDTLSLTPGKDYSFDFFWAERNTSASDFAIETSIPLGTVDGGGGGGGNPPPGVPLPPAVWSALTVLCGIGVVSRVRARLAARAS